MKYAELVGGTNLPQDKVPLMDELLFWAEKRCWTRLIEVRVDFAAVAMDEDRRVVAGVAAHRMLDAEYAWVDALFCLDTCEGQGVGTSLLQATLDAEALLPCDRLALTTKYGSKEFYEHLGFTETAPGELGSPLAADRPTLELAFAARLSQGRLAELTPDVPSSHAATRLSQ